MPPFRDAYNHARLVRESAEGLGKWFGIANHCKKLQEENDRLKVKLGTYCSDISCWQIRGDCQLHYRTNDEIQMKCTEAFIEVKRGEYKEFQHYIAEHAAKCRIFSDELKRQQSLTIGVARLYTSDKPCGCKAENGYCIGMRCGCHQQAQGCMPKDPVTGIGCECNVSQCNARLLDHAPDDILGSILGPKLAELNAAETAADNYVLPDSEFSFTPLF